MNNQDFFKDLRAEGLGLSWAQEKAFAAQLAAKDERIAQLEAETRRWSDADRKATKERDALGRQRKEDVAQARAEALMDASWLIWEKVMGTAKELEVVKECREAIEAEAQAISPGAKAYHARKEGA